MKKITKVLLSCILALIAVVGMTACKEVENGSEIQRMYIELEFLNAAGEVEDTQKVEIKLYKNFAPKTTERFMKLAKEGFYDGTTISNVTTSWCEFGGYTRQDNKLVAKDYAETLDGEFKKNGFLGNELSSATGVLIMKRNYDDKDSGVSQYNSAKSSVIMTFSAVSQFDAEEYCVFGTIVADDGENASDSSTDRSKLNSLAKVDSIRKLQQSEAGVKTYYYEKSAAEHDAKYAAILSDYYTVVTGDDEITHYYKGATQDPLNELTEESLELYRELFAEKSNYFLTIPYTEVRIKSITNK